MRHKRGGYKLKRDKGARKSLFRGLVTSVIDQERVITTVPKAKAVQPLVDRMITLAKRDTLHTRRQAAAFLETPAAVKKLFDTLGTRFGQRPGGYTRIVKLGFRKGDGAPTRHLPQEICREFRAECGDRRQKRDARGAHCRSHSANARRCPLTAAGAKDYSCSWRFSNSISSAKAVSVFTRFSILRTACSTVV